jgi:chromosome segregation ATPase
MEANASVDAQLQSEVDALKLQFSSTQDIYREVSTLLFFRHGITPTANKLYQLVRRGSMSAPAESLAKFWADLREKSRVRIEHPDLPEELKASAGILVSTLWATAQDRASESLSALRLEAQASVLEAKASTAEAVAAKNSAHRDLLKAGTKLDAASGRIRELEQTLAGQTATCQALEVQVKGAHDRLLEQQHSIEATRQDFSLELKKLREALATTEERYEAAQSRAMLEIDRERTISSRVQKDLENARSSFANLSERHRAEIRELQEVLGSQKQRIGHLEGENQYTATSLAQLASELEKVRENLIDRSTRLAAALHEADVWQSKAIKTYKELDELRRQRKRKSKAGSVQLDLPRLP